MDYENCTQISTAGVFVIYLLNFINSKNISRSNHTNYQMNMTLKLKKVILTYRYFFRIWLTQTFGTHTQETTVRELDSAESALTVLV